MYYWPCNSSTFFVSFWYNECASSVIKYCERFTERWLSGWRRTPRKRVIPNGVREFKSLPLRHCFLRHFCLSTEVPFSCQFVYISRRKVSSAIKQVSSVILQVRNLIKRRFGGKLVVKQAGESLSFCFRWALWRAINILKWSSSNYARPARSIARHSIYWSTSGAYTAGFKSLYFSGLIKHYANIWVYRRALYYVHDNI